MERRDRRRAVALGLVVALGLAPRPAQAETANARVLFQEGVQSLRLGDYAAAVESFRASYRKKPAAATVCNLALTYERWHNHDQEALEAYLTCATDDNTGTFKRHALERVRALRDKLTTAPPPQPVEEVPPRVDERPTPDTPPPVRVQPRVVTRAPEPVALASEPAPMPPPRRSHNLLWAGIGVSVVGVALLGGAIGVGEVSRSTSESLELRYPSHIIPAGSTGEVDLEDARSKRTASVGLYAAGGLVAAVGLSLMIGDAARPRR